MYLKALEDDIDISLSLSHSVTAHHRLTMQQMNKMRKEFGFALCGWCVSLRERKERGLREREKGKCVVLCCVVLCVGSDTDGDGSHVDVLSL